MSEVTRLKVDDKVYDLDFDKLTLGELELIEKEFDKPLSEIDLESIRGILVLAWIARRQVEPLCSLDEMRALPASSVEVVDEVPLEQEGAVVEVGDEISGVQS